MRLLHLADLHLGKMLCGVSLLENGDQGFWTERLLELIEEKRPDAVLVAGDVYDRGLPPGGATELLSTLATGISRLGIPLLMAAGNHDSGQRLACFRDILCRQQVHISGVLRRELVNVTLTDEYGPVTFWLLPYTFPAAVSQVLDDDSIRDYDDAVRRIIAEQDIDFTRRNVIIAHQNVTAGGVEGIRGGSESLVGGVGQVDYTAFDGFDYVALGHIHAAYAVGRDTVRYAGSPMCYHFDELRQAKKGPLLVTLGEKGAPVQIETLSIPPLHPLCEYRGEYEDVLLRANLSPRGQYVKTVITDRPMTPEMADHLSAVFTAKGSILMECSSEFRRFSGAGSGPELGELETRPVEELFADFYTERAGGQPEREDLELMGRAAELVRNSDGGADGREVSPALAEKLVDYLIGEGT
ncbi:MAG: exonuclease SbcCD subunit D [Oscillospiraceae bacterium]|nr:exonuclease SbcCD subunit D [Oscillospiraceae bacterium]